MKRGGEPSGRLRLESCFGSTSNDPHVPGFTFLYQLSTVPAELVSVNKYTCGPRIRRAEYFSIAVSPILLLFFYLISFIRGVTGLCTLNRPAFFF